MKENIINLWSIDCKNVKLPFNVEKLIYKLKKYRLLRWILNKIGIMTIDEYFGVKTRLEYWYKMNGYSKK